MQETLVASEYDWRVVPDDAVSFLKLRLIFLQKSFLQDRNKEFYYGTEIAIFQK